MIANLLLISNSMDCSLVKNNLQWGVLIRQAYQMLSYTTMRTVSDLPSLLPASFLQVPMQTDPNKHLPENFFLWVLLEFHIHTYSLLHKKILKSRDITLSTKVRLVKAMVFPAVMYRCESWTVKKAEHRKIDAFELWFWRRLLRFPWTARRSNQSVLKEISPGCSLEGLMLKLKL